MFAAKHPSTAWEALPLARCPGLAVWAWFRPAAMPSSVTVMVPAEVATAFPAGLPFSVNDLLVAAAIDCAQFSAISLYGSAWQQAHAYFPYLNQAVPAPVQGVTAEILLSVFEPMYPAFLSGPAPGSIQTGGVIPSGIVMQQSVYQGAVAANASWGQPSLSGMVSSEVVSAESDDFESQNAGKSLYDRIEASWKSAVQMERQMTGLRQKLSTLANTLGKMDRDLSPEERLAADREDKDAWEDARRWVRDLAGKCHREVKAFDIGMTSSAGKRNWMEQTYQTVIEPRAKSLELETYRRDFETYRKDIMNLQRTMSSAIQAATQNGTSRSQRVTGAIQKKVQARRRQMREPIGGTNMDRSCRRRR